MNPTDTCLTKDQLRRLALNEVAPPELREIEDHVDACDRCRDILKSVDADPDWHKDLLTALREPSETIAPWNVGMADIDADASLTSILSLLGPTDDPQMLGRIGVYEVVGVIGRGGMGVVFKAYDRSLNRFVAIKMLLPHLAVSGAARRRFAREGQAAAAVVDDQVLPIYCVAEWQGVPYLVTQYTPSTTLQHRIERQGPLELKEILRIGMQTARGLAAAHAQGLVHRDVKPSNILLDGTVERALLTDFGLARAIDDATLTRSGIIAGTPGYMSPEQTRGDAIDHRSDLFSLGSVFYAMCTGHPPFRAETTFGVMHRIREEVPRSIREINPDLPDWVEQIVSKLLEKMPDRRFASANELAAVLEQCLAHVQQPLTVTLPASLLKASKKPSRLPARPSAGNANNGSSPSRFQRVAIRSAIVFMMAAGLVLAAVHFRSPPLKHQAISESINVERSVAGSSLSETSFDWDDRQDQLDQAAQLIEILEGSTQQDIAASAMQTTEGKED